VKIVRGLHALWRVKDDAMIEQRSDVTAKSGMGNDQKVFALARELLLRNNSEGKKTWAELWHGLLSSSNGGVA
jgi:hypothetical protein